MQPDERNEKIAAYGAAYEQLRAALERFPKAMWHFRPGAERWTIHEIVVHITDSEANSYVRCRRFLAEPGSAILGYDEMRWARELDYQGQDAETALELFRWLRQSSYLLVKDLPADAWSKRAVHSESGEMTLEEWLEIYTRHIPDHVAQMQAVYDDWLTQSQTSGQER